MLNEEGTLSIYKCKNCNDEYTPDNSDQWKKNGVCSEECSKLHKRKTEPREYLSHIGVRERFLGCRFKSFDPKCPEDGNVVQGLSRYHIASEGLADNVFIHGGAGNGKTHLSVSLLLRVGTVFPIDIKFINATELLMEIRSSFDSYHHGNNEREILEKYCKYDMLCLDDLGSEKTSEYSLQVFYLILNTRYENIKPTIITSNLSLYDISQAYGNRIASRIGSGFKYELKGLDQRVQNRKGE